MNCWGAWDTTCTCGHKPTSITPSISWRFRKRKCWTIFLKRTRKGHRQSDRHCNSLKIRQRWGSFRETMELIWAFLTAWIPSWTELKSLSPGPKLPLSFPTCVVAKLPAFTWLWPLPRQAHLQPEVALRLVWYEQFSRLHNAVHLVQLTYIGKTGQGLPPLSQ